MGLPSEIITGLIGSSGYSGYEIDQSMVLDGSTDYLSWTPGGAGDDNVWTTSCWFKLCEIGAVQGLWCWGSGSTSGAIYCNIEPSGTLLIADATSSHLLYRSNRLFRDPGAWYHLVVGFDNTQATASDRIKVELNGVEITEWSTSTAPQQNKALLVNTASAHSIGHRNTASPYLDGYIAEFYHIDGSKLDASSFGEFYNGTQWRAIDPSGLTYGTNGFHLDFSNAANLGEDQAGSNDWTVNGSPSQSSDSPTVNYATFNALQAHQDLTLQAGNRETLNTNNTTFKVAAVTSALAGKIYAELKSTTIGTYPTIVFGIFENGQLDHNGISPDISTTGWAVINDNAGTTITSQHYYGSRTNNTVTNKTTRTPAANDVLQIAFDADTGDLWLGINNTWLGGGDPATGTSPTYSGLTSTNGYIVYSSIYNTSSPYTVNTLNCGQDAYDYTPPTGFNDLYAANLPEVTITDPGEHFNAVAYTGTAATGNAITGVGFQPDFTWQKRRDSTGHHVLTDVVRGVDKQLFSSLTNAEQTSSLFVESFDSDGFTVGNNSIGTGDNNYASGGTYISWNWKAGGAGVVNTDGTISSTVSVNDDAGCSIVKWDGTGTAGTIGHGQTAAPEMIIAKCFVENSATGSGTIWPVYHKGVASDAETDYLRLNATNAAADLNTYWNDTAPTDSVFSVGTNVQINASVSGGTAEYIAYCFRSIPGYSKVFSYTGNGSADGPFVYLGFKPRWCLLRQTTATNQWIIFDSERNTYNVIGEQLYANLSSAGAIETRLDFLCNGIKLRSSGSTVNGSGMIGIAFAETPFGGSNLPLGLAR